jgi:acetyl-CoA synthetase
MSLDYRSYEEAKEKFNWKDKWSLFDGTKDRFNIAHECIDRHPKADTAIRIKFADGRSEMYTFGQFSEYTCRFANYLESKGVEFGEKVVILLFPSIELYVSMFGLFKRGAVAIMCFPLFGPEAINFRLSRSNAKAIITTKAMTDLIDIDLADSLGLKIIYAEDLMAELQNYSDRYEWNTDVSTICMMQFSSGTTGEPKSILYKHGAISVAGVVMKLGNGLRHDDIYFCPSSPGWGHGIWYGTIAPLIHGRAIGTFSGKFDTEKVLEALEEWRVTIMAAISSHYRLIMESPNVGKYNVKLRTVNYTGEAMTKDTIAALRREWGIYPATQYGTTEAGPIAMDFMAFDNWAIRPGSLGKIMLGGIRIAILDENEQEVPPGTPGQVALWRNNAWFKIGDSAFIDEDGYVWYIGRIDDLIISSGYTIGPIEVEGAINKHPAVEECAVIGSPDKNRGNIVKAVVVLKKGIAGSDSLEEDIKNFVKTRLSKHEYPRKIEFTTELPKTPDGKIKRKLLKEKEKQLLV